MNRVMRSTVVLAAALGALSCKGDPTDSLRNGIDHLVATPSAIYVDNGATQSVLIEAVDDQGNRLSGNFQVTAGSFGPGIDVAPDDSFNLVYNENGALVPPKNWTRAKFDVTALQYVADSFQVTVGGKSLYVRVRVNPVTLASTIANPTPAIGATVTLAAPAGLVFDPATTTVSFTPGGTAVITAISTTSVSFIPIPGSSGAATVTNVTPTYAPLGPFTLQTVDRLDVAAVSSVPITITPAAPLAGDTITITAGAGYKLLPNAGVSIPGFPAPIITGRAADSSSISFIVAPGSNGNPVISNVVLDFLLSVPLTVTGSALLDQPTSAASIYAGTDDPTTAPVLILPAVGDSIEFFDRFDGALIDQFYGFDGVTGQSITITTDWTDPATDLDVLRCQPAAPACSGAIGTFGATAAKPESANRVLSATGRFVLDFNVYAGPKPTWIRVKIVRIS